MWVVRAYDPETDELVDEHDLPEATKGSLVQLLSLTPTDYGSTPLSGKRLERLAETYGFPIIKDAEYFLDFDGRQVGSAC